MREITDSLDKFTVAIQSDQFIEFNEQGCWQKETGWSRFVSWIYSKFFGDGDRLQKATQIFCSAALDRLETEKVYFFTSIEERKSNQDRYHQFIHAGKVLQEKTKNIESCHAVRQLLKQRLVALQYRIEVENGGIAPFQDSPESHGQYQIRNAQAKLVELAKKWKESQPLYLEKEKSLSQRDIKRLTETARYSKFAKLITSDKASPVLRKNFFEWTIRDGGNIQPLIEYPATFEKIGKAKKAFLLPDISVEMQNEDDAVLAIEMRAVDANKVKKILTLPVEGPDGQITTKNILNDSKVLTLKEGWKITFNEILKQFAKQNTHIPDVIFYGRCLRNWNSHQLGWRLPLTPGSIDELKQTEGWEDQVWKRIDITQKNWWEQLPKGNPISKDNLMSRYRIETLEEGQWVIIARAARAEKSKSINHSHGFFEIAIPDSTSVNQSVYYQYPLGAFAENFPDGELEMLLFLANTLKAKISYPDKNIDYQNRQHAGIPYVLTEKQAEILMQLIQKDLMEARKGNIVFQFAGESCANRPQKYIDAIMGEPQDLFIADLIDVHVPFVNGIFKVANAIDPIIHQWSVEFISWFLGGNRGIEVEDEEGNKVFRSLKSFPLFRDDYKTHLPAKIFYDERASVWFGEKPDQRVEIA